MDSFNFFRADGENKYIETPSHDITSDVNKILVLSSQDTFTLQSASDNLSSVRVENGSVSNPSITNKTNLNTGIYFDTNEIDVSVSGSRKFQINSTGINCDKITLNTIGTNTNPSIQFGTNSGIYKISNGTINIADGSGTGSMVSFLQDGSKTCQFNNITCSTINGGTTIGTSTTTPKLILTQVASTSDPQIQSSNDAFPKCGVNISENSVQIVCEATQAANFQNGQIIFDKLVVIKNESNALTSRTLTITATNSDNRVQKLNFTSADCTYILPTGLRDGTRFEIIPFKTSGANNCYLQVGTGTTISVLIGGVKTNYSTSGTNIAIVEGYAYNLIYQESITTWIVWRSS